ncbi:leucine-rich repeat-containing protein 59 [Malaya genurostris]|uniref:leucine-rich repeat-containing protein 59 n=1 Tax=Malaya genurostris TaxID=325434 RepID=UPI0026F3E6B7|nr:leucine-rich repeat-containing protein 59 [Malaya genurostris]
MHKRAKFSNDDQDKINVRERLNDNVLDLSLMNITTIPVNDIKALKRATILDLSNNAITIINKNFTSLVQLTKLDLSNNKIQLITDDFGNLENLRHLNLYSNKIERLPLSFGRLKKLKYLDLKNNPLNPAFSKVIGACSDQRGCIDAARKATAFMADVERQVMEERRKEQEQKELECRQQMEATLKETNREKESEDRKKRKKNKRSATNTINKESEKHNTGLKLLENHKYEIKSSNIDHNERSNTKKIIFVITAVLFAYIFVVNFETLIGILN